MRSARRLLTALCGSLAAVAVAGCFGSATPGTGAPTILEGALRNEYGRPATNVALSVGSVTATTDPDGAFRLTGLTGGDQTIVLRAKGYVDRSLTVTLKAGQVNKLTEPGQGGPVVLKTVHSLARSQANLSQAMRGAQPHSACDSCHSVSAPVGTKFLAANSKALCLQDGCHSAPGGGAWEHPSAHLDSSQVKPVGELAQYDQLACLRCHVSHATAPGGSLTPGFPATVTSASYASYCATCHNGGQQGNTFDPATHNPGSDCTSACHTANGTAKGHSPCARAGGCHGPSASIVQKPGHVAGGCGSCHDTSGSAANLLKEPINDTCLICHPTMMPLEPHDTLACTECHVVHSLTLYDDWTCIMCHWGGLPAARPRTLGPVHGSPSRRA